MPTENRSSNTEMVSVKRELLARIEAALDRHMAGHAPMRIPADQTDSDLVREDVRQALTEPAQQSKPVACSHEWTDDGEFLLVCTKCGEQEDHDPKWRDMTTAPRDGTLVRLLVEFTEHATEDSEAIPSPTIGANSFDLTGEDVWQFAGWSWEQDCFTQGEGEPVGWLPMLDTPHADPAEADQLRRDLHAAKVALEARARTFDTLRAQLAEAQALLDRVVDHVKFWHDHPYAECLHGVVRDYQALSASAVPSAPLPPVNGDLLPPIGSKVLIHLAREDKWVEHTVVGYYAWGNHGLDQNVNRVFVRVRDAEGYLSARLLSDVRPIVLERKP